MITFVAPGETTDTALPGLVNEVVPATVTLPPPAPWMNALPEPPETVSVPNVRDPDALFWNDTPSVPPVTVVLPNASVPTVWVPIRMPCVVGLATVVEPNVELRVDVATAIPWVDAPVIETAPVTVRLPPVPVKLMPGPPVLLDDVILSNVAAKVPVVKFNVLPVPLRAISVAVNVPYPDPEMSDAVEFPISNPRRVLPDPRLIALVAAIVVVTVGRAPPTAGNGSLPVASVMPAMPASVVVAPWPISF